MEKPVVLILLNNYLPGYKSGGPVRTIANMVDQLGDEIDFRIVASDRDNEDTAPYPGVVVNDWNTVGKGQVFYTSPGSLTFRNLRRLLRNTQYDFLYLQSFFSYKYTIRPLLLRKLHLIPPKPIILAPRGEFSPGALKIKSSKKRLFLGLSKILRLHKKVTLHASSEIEKKHIEQWLPSHAGERNGNQIKIALDPSPKCDPSQNGGPSITKEPGTLRILFLSRVTPMKNLDFALKVLKGVRGKILFDIYGPIDRDKEYWETCKRLISEIPEPITVEYKGPVSHNEVQDTFAQYHAFLLPTRGENFGHVIAESLSAGCPIILSDRTPWNGLDEKQSGWNIPLDKPEKYQEVLEQLIAMDNDQWKTHVQHAIQHATQAANNQDVLTQNRQLFL